MKNIKIIATLLAIPLFLATLSACSFGESDTTNEDDAFLDSFGDSDTTNEDDAFLELIHYPKYKLIDEKLGYTGRWFEKEIDGESHMVTLNDGSEFYFLINGADFVDVIFTVITTNVTPYYAYSIDGSVPVRSHINESKIILPDNGRHIVRIIADGLTETEGKWLEQKGFALKDVVVPEGAEIKGVLPQNKVIAFFGDSITEGIRALNMNADSDGNSATNAYPWYCAQNLETIAYNVGFGATGIISVGSFNTCINAIDYIAQDIEVPDNFVPDLIVINHGTNDSNANSQDFIDGCIEVLDRFSEKYPSVPLVYVIPFMQTKADEIRFCMQGYRDDYYLIETNDWELTFTDGVHPDAEGAKTAGKNLADELIKIFGKDFF